MVRSLRISSTVLCPLVLFACGGTQGTLGDATPDIGAVIAFSGRSADAALDEDGDAIGNFRPDNCAGSYNPGQEDQDGDGLGDLCDWHPSIADTSGIPTQRGTAARRNFFDEVDAYADAVNETSADAISVTMVRVCREDDDGPFALNATNLKAGLRPTTSGNTLLAVVEPSLRIGFQRLSFSLDDAEAFRASAGSAQGYGSYVRFWDDRNDNDLIDSSETVYGYAHWHQSDPDFAGVLFGAWEGTYVYPIEGCNPEDPYCTDPQNPSPQYPDCDDEIGSPLVIDLGHDGFASFSAPEVRFDLDGDGARDLVGWPTSPDDALLALDRNHNRMIDDGGELFGNFTDGGAHPNGFEALADLDSDGNGAIDADDPAYDELLVWSDKNGDGLSQADELTSLAENDVISVSVQYMSMNETDGNGNVTRERAAFTYEKDGRLAAGLVIDVWFAMEVSPLFE